VGFVENHHTDTKIGVEPQHHDRVAPDGAVKTVDMSGDSRFGCLPREKSTVRQTSSDFKFLKVSTMALSKQLPLPEIEMWTPWQRSSASWR
jgi:hypothetical protein